MRIALYSHDALGLGHLRRNLVIAGALGQIEGVSTLLVTGCREASAFPAPEGVDYLSLPGFAKDPGGGYGPRFLRISNERLTRLRATTMCAALEAFAPDALIVDKHPLGLFGELEPALDRLAEMGTRCVLGLRDVLDQPEKVRAEWAGDDAERAVRERYDSVWVYGDPRVYDLVRECGLGDTVAERAHYTGYLGAGRVTAADHGDDPEVELPDGRVALCLVGGGQDGFSVAEAFASAAMPDDTHGVVVTGPLMPAAQREALRRRAGASVQVVDFLPNPAPLIDRADAVVAMGGYNTVCELLAKGKRSLIVPRVAPRAEQLIRARRLERRGHVDVLHPSRACASSIGGWLERPSRAPRRTRGPIDLDGLQRLPGLLRETLSLDSRPCEQKVAA